MITVVLIVSPTVLYWSNVTFRNFFSEGDLAWTLSFVHPGQSWNSLEQRRFNALIGLFYFCSLMKARKALGGRNKQTDWSSLSSRTGGRGLDTALQTRGPELKKLKKKTPTAQLNSTFSNFLKLNFGTFLWIFQKTNLHNLFDFFKSKLWYLCIFVNLQPLILFCFS